MEPIRFAGTIRHWNPEKAGGLAVAIGDEAEVVIASVGRG